MAGQVIRHNLSDGYVEVQSGPVGMATTWDCDIVIMMISHLKEAMHRFRGGRGLPPVDYSIATHHCLWLSLPMKLSVWARRQGLCYKTAWRMGKDGKLPVPAEQLPTGTVIVHAEERQPGGVALYARVSSADQEADLDRQLARLTEWALAKRLPIVDAIKEVGSGMNGPRKGLLLDPKVGVILVEHRDRLMRLGFEHVEAALAAHGRSLLVVDPEERTDDIVRDLHEVIESMCARLYDKRSATNRAKKVLEALDG